MANSNVSKNTFTYSYIRQGYKNTSKRFAIPSIEEKQDNDNKNSFRIESVGKNSTIIYHKDAPKSKIDNMRKELLKSEIDNMRKELLKNESK